MIFLSFMRTFARIDYKSKAALFIMNNLFTAENSYGLTRIEDLFVQCEMLVEVIELIPEENFWYTQKLSCGHTGRIWITETIVERIEILIFTSGISIIF
jgi:hypothetical protein